jgi:hypothetical protein
MRQQSFSATQMPAPTNTLICSLSTSDSTSKMDTILSFGTIEAMDARSAVGATSPCKRCRRTVLLLSNMSRKMLSVARSASTECPLAVLLPIISHRSSNWTLHLLIDLSSLYSQLLIGLEVVRFYGFSESSRSAAGRTTVFKITRRFAVRRTRCFHVTLTTLSLPTSRLLSQDSHSIP